MNVDEHLARIDADPAYACAHHIQAARDFTDNLEAHLVVGTDEPAEWVVGRINGHLVRAVRALIEWLNEGIDHG